MLQKKNVRSPSVPAESRWYIDCKRGITVDHTAVYLWLIAVDHVIIMGLLFSLSEPVYYRHAYHPVCPRSDFDNRDETHLVHLSRARPTTNRGAYIYTSGRIRQREKTHTHARATTKKNVRMKVRRKNRPLCDDWECGVRAHTHTRTSDISERVYVCVVLWTTAVK